MAITKKTTKTVTTDKQTVEKEECCQACEKNVKELEAKIGSLEKSLSEALSLVKELQEKVSSTPKPVAATAGTVDGEARSAIRDVIKILRSNRRPNMEWPKI